MSVKSLLLPALFTAALGLGTAQAATIVVQNNNEAGVGFNDASTPNANAGCQTGETLGQCRLRVFNTAAQQWGDLLDSNVTITVRAQMIPQTCSGTSAVLGSAGPRAVSANFDNAPMPGTAYVQALANALAGYDMFGGNYDINANFNVTLDAGCLNNTVGWWYDTDGDHPVPSNRIALLPVVFHEIAHGLGFTSLYSPTTGGSSTGTSTPVWGHFLKDLSTGKLWKEMSNAERLASTTNGPNLVWTGPITTAELPNYLGKPAAVIVNSPAAIAGIYNAMTAGFGPTIYAAPVTGDVVEATPNDGCTTLTNAAQISGNLALIDRGTCNFAVKVKNAQLAGAIGVIVANNIPDAPINMGGDDATITIPSLHISQADGATIKAHLPGVNASLGQDESAELAGTTDGYIRMYAPNPAEPGSSVSHFDVSAYPDLLMEPAINDSLFDEVDLTLPLFRDIGWNPDTTPPVQVEIFEDEFEGDAPDPNFTEHFDDYAPGSQMHGVNGWKGWEVGAPAGAMVTNIRSHSPSNSLAVAGATDLVHEFSGMTRGQWTISAWQFVPPAFTGESYFIALNTFDESSANYNWSMQIKFDSDAGTVSNDSGVDGGSASMITGQWVELRLELDLDADTGTFYYNGTQLYTGSWSEQVSGDGSKTFAALDLFANEASVIYYDDIKIEKH